MTPTAIIFDLDDTLYPEQEFVRSGFRAVGDWCRANVGLPDFAARATANFVAGGRRNVFDRVLAGYGFAPQPALIEQLVAIYREHLPSITLFPEARDCLSALGYSFSLGLITDGPGRAQRNKIHKLAIEDRFEVILVTSELGDGFSKPHAKSFRLIEERFELSGDQLAYVGDNPRKDFQAPGQLGWHTVRVDRGVGIYAGASEGTPAAHLISDLSELVAIFR